MDLEYIFWALVVIILDVLVFIYLGRKIKAWWKKANADGEITLDEVLEVVDDVKEIIEEIKELPSLSSLKKMKKDELIALAEEKGLDTSGTKSDIIERLTEKV